MAAPTPVQIGNNDILVEMRSSFRHVLSMLDREPRIIVQVECPQCGTNSVAEFYNATGATRHVECANCKTRFVAHLDATRRARTKVDIISLENHTAPVTAPAPVRAEDSAIVSSNVSCPHCGELQTASFGIQPGATRHLTCSQCLKGFVAHKKHDGSVLTKVLPVVGPERSRFEAALRKTKFWVEPSSVSILVEKACAADAKLNTSGNPKSPKSLEDEMVGEGLSLPAKVANIFVKIIVHGGAFEFQAGLPSSKFYAQYVNQLNSEGLIQAYYRGMVGRLRSQFPGLDDNCIEELRETLKTDLIPNADEALKQALDQKQPPP